MEPFLILILLTSSTALVLMEKDRWNYHSILGLVLIWIFFQREGFSIIFLEIGILGLCWYSCLKMTFLLKKREQENLEKFIPPIQQKRTMIESLAMSDSVIFEESKILARSLAQKEALYESLKELNKTLEFSKTIEVASNLISQLTSFEKGWLWVSAASENNATPSLCYELSRNEKPMLRKGNFEENFTDSQKKLLTRCIHSRTPVFINHPDQDPSLSPQEIFSGMALSGISLFHEETFLGAFLIEGCKKKELESLEILALQLSMEIKETLLYEKVRNLSFMDGLTQVYLRRHLLLLLEEELKRLQQQKKPCSILMVDLDYFKSFNDHFGHLVGDILLKQISMSLQENLRPMDLVGRFGGEEFMIALPETMVEEALDIAERIRTSVEKAEYWIHEKRFKLTLSIGIANYPQDALKLSLLIQMADTALYQAKNQGRNRTCIYHQ
ncbi:MAG: GGDEF domain-containing protein [Chlamydiae bacterium]|nr:GGDEF domain-containing protein [Chlamydiota bacterium]MBI3276169.1 GGDEF domain-containing protein [Chlamydiota bacterium]